MADLLVPIDEAPLAFLDVETTGLHPEFGDRVCEIAILRCQGSEVVDVLQQLVNPQRHMGAGAWAVHGLSDDMLADAPPFCQIAASVLALLEGTILVGHNTVFDLRFLAAELGRVGLPVRPLVTLDTLRLARYCYHLPSYALARVASVLGVEVVGQTHRAMHDVLLTRGVFARLVDELYPLGIRSVDDYVRAQGGQIACVPAPVYDVPPLIEQALQDNVPLRLRYISEQGQETVRMVRAIGISLRGGSMSLVAHCYLRDALRHFRVDRIAEMELVQELG